MFVRQLAKWQNPNKVQRIITLKKKKKKSIWVEECKDKMFTTVPETLGRIKNAVVLHRTEESNKLITGNNEVFPCGNNHIRSC